ncbi:MAG: hypothetical protein QOK23_1903 [Gammaproteobacteria bacterium]|jgi:hypothetical protein|nr:hypothetical protein [Gammaproteobacteria bacterium]
MPADIKIKAGIIEGFFGKPWDCSARLSSANFLRDAGYKFYIYAPKSDSFLRRRWREPIPEQTLEHLRELRGLCRQSSLAFGIGLTPFEIYLNYNTGAQALLRSKVLQINGIGADTLCILFDDMRGDIEGLADLQARVICDICAWSNAECFIICPTYYSYDLRLTRRERGSLAPRAGISPCLIARAWRNGVVSSSGSQNGIRPPIAKKVGELKPSRWNPPRATERRASRSPFTP